MAPAAVDRAREEFGHSNGHSHGLPKNGQVRLSGLVIDRLTVTPAAGTKSLLCSTPATRTRKGTWLFSASLAAAAAFVAADRSWNRFGFGPVAEAVSESQVARTVHVERPSLGGTSNVVLPATVRPWQTATLHARASGYLAAWHFDIGANVHTGDLLAELDTPELDQELAGAEALAREALAAADQAQAELVEARAELKVSEAQLARVEAQHKLAKTQLARREKLVASRAVAQDEYDTFFREEESRTADVAAAKADVGHRKANLLTRAATIEVRQATAGSRQANVQRLKELQGFKRIVAPFDAVVTRRSAEVGMLVTAGKEPLFVLEDMSRVRVQLPVPQTYAALVATGTPATVNLPESTDEGVTAVITRATLSIESSSRTMLAEIELENSARQFQPGSYAQVALTTSHDKTWTIPTNTLSMRIDGPHVAVVNAQNQIEQKAVRLGRDMGTRISVVEGIQGDERLVVNPGEDLVNGTQVRIVGDEKSAASVAQR